MKLHKVWIKVWPRIGWVGSFLLLVGAGVLISKFCEESVRVHERGALVASIVDQQFHQLSSEAPIQSLGRASQIDLKKWVIQQVFTPSQPPAELARQIDSFKVGLRGRSSLRVTLDRWSNTLQEWQKKSKSHSHVSDDLIREGKQHYFEAAGFRKVGRAYDATILNLWTITLLTSFVNENPYNVAVPEALFMLGSAYAALGRALPLQMRGDRILNLCSELYPDSLWADKSQTIWREASGDEI